MKKKLSIFGCTGSIGDTTLKLLNKKKKEYSFYIFSGYKNYKKIKFLIKKYKPKFFVIFDDYTFKKVKKENIKNNVKILNSIDYQNFQFKKSDVSILAIPGIAGLPPTLKAIRISKKVLIANKESIICGWNLIKKKLEKFKTQFIPVDSEHFSIWSLIKDSKKEPINKIYITASGGPFINLPKKKFNKIKLSDALKHPNWKMGKKITIDSSTLMNKVFEVIEAKNIFNIDYDKISILTHRKSYIHAIVKFNNGLTKIVAHDPDMKIPIKNSLDFLFSNEIKSKPINFDILNNLELKKVDTKKFPLVNILKKLPERSSLFETVLITLNDLLVYKFLDKKISYTKLIRLILKISNLKEFQKYKKIKPKNVRDIYNLRDYVHLKLSALGI